MTWVFFALGAALSWGLYGPTLHRGQVMLGNPMKALLCVGIAYFLVGVLVPVITLGSQGDLKGFARAGTCATGAGIAGRDRRRLHHLRVPRGRPAGLRDAAGLRRRPARQRAGVDGDAPAQESPNPLLWAGYVLASVGAALVLYFKPA